MALKSKDALNAGISPCNRQKRIPVILRLTAIPFSE